MSVDLNQEVCANCGVRLTDQEPVIENEGSLYCCGNCFLHATMPATQSAPGAESCSQCGFTIVDKKSQVRQGMNVYCCSNCANARERVSVGRPV